jgi:hypothetical protein
VCTFLVFSGGLNCCVLVCCSVVLSLMEFGYGALSGFLKNGFHIMLMYK